ncbi:MAG: helix-turn-helix transcriptional regulator [bacterium]|nr:helix-turn-helix transcriptional regulator [bacterium]
MKEPKFDPERITGDISKQVVDYLQRKKGKTVEQIAKMASVSESFIYRVKRGKTKFTVTQLLKINRKMKGDIISPLSKKLLSAFRTIMETLM